jgi:hypothetical protein
MCGNIRSVNEATLEWEGRDWSGAGVRTSTMAVRRSSRDSISWKTEYLVRSRILWPAGRTIPF